MASVSCIVISQEQADQIAAAESVIEVYDGAGTVLGYIAPPVPEEDIAIARSRMGSNGPRLSIHQVLAHLQSLEKQ